MYKENCSMCLGDDLTDAEALAIVQEELYKINPITLAAELASGNYSSVQNAVKNSVQRICVKGATKKLNNVYVWVGVAIALLLIGYLIVR